MELKILTPVGSPSPWTSFRPAVEVAASLDLETALKFIQLCSEESNPSHKKDANPGPLFLPTRVLDIGLNPQDNSGEAVITLKETGEAENGIYMTLSHCWGSKEFITSSKRTYAQRQKAIRTSELPQSFRDAVEITRGLGIRYLWIDSLCIIQDGPRDWEIESSKMADVFSNSWLNVAISHSADSGGGCFVDRTHFSSVSSVTSAGTTRKLQTHRIRGTEPTPYEVLVRPDFKVSHWELSRPMQVYDQMRKRAPLVNTN